MNLSCPKDYSILKNKMECIKYDILDLIKNILENNKNITEKSKEEEIKYYDNILEIVEKEFTSYNYNISNLDNGKDEIIESEKLIITFTTTQNQKNNENNNMTRIDLGECEILLRNFYNISINETLYLKKIDIIQEGMKTLKVEYDVYAKLNGKNLIKLNLTVCEKSKISISIPIIINEDLDILNSSSEYYNDICYTTTTEDGTDILLKDRQREFIDQNKMICQEDCGFSEYNYDTSVAKCSCDVKESSKSFADMNINKEAIFDNFKNIKNFLNFNFLICYKKLFTKKGILNNIGCYYKNKFVKTTKICHQITLNDTRGKKNFKNNKDEKENLEIYIDEEINGFSYNMAIKYDKRTYCLYYASLLKTQHNLICALFNNNDYNCGIIKINLFFLQFTIEYTVNALFYNDDTMHKIYESKGDFDLETQLPIAVYSTIISTILNYPLNFLALSNDTIINFKQNITNIKIMKKAKVLTNILSKKFVLFFIISFLFLIFFWYYISMFGVIYKNTQIHLLKDTLMSFGLSLVIPFIFYLFPGIFRIPSLSNINKRRKYLYNFSKFLQSV